MLALLLLALALLLHRGCTHYPKHTVWQWCHTGNATKNCKVGNNMATKPNTNTNTPNSAATSAARAGWPVANATVVLLQPANPKRPGSRAHALYAVLASACGKAGQCTMAQYSAAMQQAGYAPHVGAELRYNTKHGPKASNGALLHSYVAVLVGGVLYAGVLPPGHALAQPAPTAKVG